MRHPQPASSLSRSGHTPTTSSTFRTCRFGPAVNQLQLEEWSGRRLQSRTLTKWQVGEFGDEPPGYSVRSPRAALLRD
jgi:hypothetical protein